VTGFVATVVLASSALAAVSLATQRSAGEALVYLGTYTGPKSKGIYVSRFNFDKGVLSTPELAAEIENPSFLAVHPSQNFLYAANEVGTYEGKPSGSVSAFAIDRSTGKLTPLNRESSGGRGPAHLVTDGAGRNVLVANYGGGSVAVLPIGQDGRLAPASSIVQHTGSSVNPDRQKEPHAHSIDVDSSDRVVYSADLGIDKVLIYRFDGTKGTLTASDPPFASVEPGSGPRHFAIHPTGGFAYAINELSMTITAFARDAAGGGLTSIQTISTLPPDQSKQKGYSTAEILTHPSGRFLYGSNRGHDSIAVFSIDEKTGRLSFVETTPTEGRTPRNFGIDPAGTYLLAANQNTDSVVVFRIDQKTGKLTPTGSTVSVGAPVCVKFVRIK
jgi:6-phosphogluconolactonase